MIQSILDTVALSVLSPLGFVLEMWESRIKKTKPEQYVAYRIRYIEPVRYKFHCWMAARNDKTPNDYERWTANNADRELSGMIVNWIWSFFSLRWYNLRNTVQFLFTTQGKSNDAL